MLVAFAIWLATTTKEKRSSCLKALGPIVIFIMAIIYMFSGGGGGDNYHDHFR
jgi:hypothetical protein